MTEISYGYKWFHPDTCRNYSQQMVTYGGKWISHVLLISAKAANVEKVEILPSLWFLIK